MYYYGARYYDARLGRWISVDPILNDYLPVVPVNDAARRHNQNLPGMGGVFTSVNLNLYHYAGNNPVKIIDPDGHQNIKLDPMTRAVMDFQSGIIGQSNGDYFAEYSGINSGRAYGEGVVHGYIDTAVGFKISSFLDKTNNSRIHNEQYEFGYKAGKYSGYAMTAVSITTGFFNLTGKKLSSELLKSSLRDIMKDPKRLKDFSKGLTMGITPEFLPNNLSNFDEVLGYVVGKVALSMMPDTVGEKPEGKGGGSSDANNGGEDKGNSKSTGGGKSPGAGSGKSGGKK